MQNHEIELHVGLQNDYKLTTHKAGPDGQPLAGTARDVSGWSPNLITNTGLDNYGVLPGYSNWARGCRIGSGNATPAVSDTNVQSLIATTVTLLSTVISRELSGASPYIEMITIYRFPVGTATGNVAEIALVGSTGDHSSAGGAMNPGTAVSTRALVVDGAGSPVVVEVLGDEILDVTVRQRLYIPADVVGTITPAGGVSGPIGYVIRPCEVDQNPSTNLAGWGIEYYGGSKGWGFENRESGGYGEWAAFVGATSAIAAVTASPAGSKVSAGAGGVVAAAYVPGTHSLSVKHSFPLGTANTGINDPAGIGAHMVSFGSCSFQIGYTPRIVKTNDMLFDITFRLSWGRYAP